MLLARLIGLAVNLFVLLMIARCLISWIRPSHYHPLIRWIEDVTEPILMPIRRVLPPWKTWGLDLSPAIAVILAVLLARLLMALLIGG